MARTEAGAALTQEHRRQQLTLRAATLRDLVALWATIDPANLAGTIGPFTQAAAVLVRARNRDSSGLAARYFRTFRTVEGIAGTATARLAQVPAAEAVTGALRGSALTGIINARKRGLSPASAARNGLVKVSGSAANLVIGGSRDTILGSIVADPAGARWQRITAGDPCAFCALIASRGAVFTAETSDFESHDHCACEPEPAYPGSRMTDRARFWSEQFDRAQQDVSVTGTSNDALNRFRRLHEGRA